MTSKSSASAGRGHRRQATAVKRSLRDVNGHLSVLNHRISARLSLKDVDLECLDVIFRRGPLTPSALARHTGLHPATLTGILDRLQRGGWIARERDDDRPDRRAVTVRALTDRAKELFALLAGMNDAMDAVCSEYSEQELELIAGFLHRTAAAAETAAGGLTREGPGGTV